MRSYERPPRKMKRSLKGRLQKKADPLFENGEAGDKVLDRTKASSRKSQSKQKKQKTLSSSEKDF